MAKGKQFTREQRRAILKAVLHSVGRGASLMVACQAAGMSRASAYRLFRRCPALRRALDRARATAIESVEAVVWRLAVEGDLRAAKTWLAGNLSKYSGHAPRPVSVQLSLRDAVSALPPVFDVAFKQQTEALPKPAD